MSVSATTFTADSAASSEAGALFRGYEDDSFLIGRERYSSSLYLHHGKLTTDWNPNRISDLTPDNLAWLLESPPEVLVIGTGRITAFPSHEVMSMLQEAHIGFECMDSRAAARTYNILLVEGRSVSAAMLLPNAEGS